MSQDEDQPDLESLLRRLAECPPEFLEVEGGQQAGGVDIGAIVCDHLRSMTPGEPPELRMAAIQQIQRGELPYQMLVSILCWLLNDEWFLARRELAPAMWSLLAADELPRLARLVRPHKFVSDADRREELVRVCLRQLGLRPRGETAASAADRLNALDSAERDRVLRATAAAERRARDVREAMARAKAQEAASRYAE